MGERIRRGDGGVMEKYASERGYGEMNGSSIPIFFGNN